MLHRLAFLPILAPASALVSDVIGEVVGSYRIKEQLGSGGMGVVYGAEHVVLGSKAAVKMLQPRHSADQEVVTRFFNEARAATRIKHPGIVAVFDFGHHTSGSAFLVMELLEGETIAQRLKRVGRLPWPRMLVLARQMAGALDAAHTAGIIHRDLKPHNLFLVPDADLPGGERVKVLDFGIAKLAVEVSGPDSTGGTRDGALLGTPKYMAPEQCRGAAHVDSRADVYSLGCVLFAMVCGDPPFSGEGNGEVIAKQIYEPPPTPSSIVRGLDPGVEGLILSCLQKTPASRPASMRALGAAIDALLARGDRGLVPEPHGPADAQAGAGVANHTLTQTPTPVPAQENGVPVPIEAEQSGQVAVHLHGAQITTTLGSSAAELATTKPPPGLPVRARQPARALVAVLSVVALGGGMALWMGSDTDSVVPRAATSADSGPVLRDVVPSPKRPPPEQAPAPAPALIAGPIKLTITSHPSGAVILRTADGAWVGQSPLTMPMLPVVGEAEFAVRLRGYREQRVVLRTDIDGSKHVVLERERTRPGARAGAAAPDAQAAPAPPPAPPKEEPVGDGTLDPFGSGEPGK